MSLGRRFRRARSREAVHAEPMSEVLGVISLPLTAVVPDNDHVAYERAINVAAVLWNASRSKDEEKRTAAIEKLLGPHDEESAEIEVLFREVIERADRLYPKLDRIIGGVTVEPLGGRRYSIEVFSIQ